MELKHMIRALVTFVLAILMLIGLGILTIFLNLIGVDISISNSFGVIFIIITSFIFLVTPWGKTVLGKDILGDIDRQLDEQLIMLNDAETLELSQALDEVSERFGIEIIAPTKRKKQKREHIDKAVRNLSDTELLHLKDRLRNGQIDEEKLLAWLEEQRQINDDNQ